MTTLLSAHVVSAKEHFLSDAYVTSYFSVHDPEVCYRRQPKGTAKSGASVNSILVAQLIGWYVVYEQGKDVSGSQGVSCGWRRFPQSGFLRSSRHLGIIQGSGGSLKVRLPSWDFMHLLL